MDNVLPHSKGCLTLVASAMIVWLAPAMFLLGTENGPTRLSLSADLFAPAVTVQGAGNIRSGLSDVQIAGASVDSKTATTSMQEGCHCVSCQLQKTTRAHSHPVYRCREKEICLPRCGWVLFGGCEDCAECACPRTVRQLLKKVITEQRTTVECKPVAK